MSARAPRAMPTFAPTERPDLEAAFEFERLAEEVDVAGACVLDPLVTVTVAPVVVEVPVTVKLLEGAVEPLLAKYTTLPLYFGIWKTAVCSTARFPKDLF